MISLSAYLRTLVASVIAITSLSIFDASAQDILYGMTQFGGTNNKGVPFQINTNGTGYFVYQNFDGLNGERPGNGARLTQLSLQRFLGQPFIGKRFAGLTEMGGTNQPNVGNRFDIIPGQSDIIPPYQFYFQDSYTGTHPTGGVLANTDGMLYATLSEEGQYGGGALISMHDVAGNGPSILGYFEGPVNGRGPKGTPIRGINNNVYGTTEFGGANDLGVIYYLDTDWHTYGLKKLIDFDGTNKGANPTGNLVVGTDGKLYGMTSKGGANGVGVIFSVNHDGSGFVKLHDFNGTTSGSNPKGSLVQFTDGKFYGMTSSGGAGGFGTIFSISITGTFMKILDFNGTNGKSPLGDLMVDTSGLNMYGVTYAGGINDKGVLFKLQNGTQFIKLYDFQLSTGSNPVGSLVMLRQEPTLKVPESIQLEVVRGAVTPEINASSTMPVYLVSSDTSVVRIDNGKLVPKKFGDATITAFQLGNHAFMPTSQTIYVNVRKSKQTIQFGTVVAKKYGDPAFQLTATASSGLPVSFAPTTNALQIDGTTATINQAGYVDITAYQSGNNLYEAAEVVVQELFIERAEQKITLSSIPRHTCCEPFSVSGTTTSGEQPTFMSDDLMIAEAYGNQVKPKGIGNVILVASTPGNINYKPAEARTTVEIIKGVQSVRLDLTQTTYTAGTGPFYAAAFSNVGLPVKVTSDPAGIAVIQDNAIYLLAAGTTMITVSQPGNGVYDPAIPISRSVIVIASSTPGVGNTINWPDLPLDRTVADPPFNLVASATSGLPVSYTSSNNAVAEIAGNLVTFKSTGTVTITALQPGKVGIAAATPVSKTFQVGKKAQYLASYLDWNVNFGERVPLLTRSSAELPIVYTVSDPGIATIENYYLIPKATGTIVVTATQPGNDKYLAAEPVYLTTRIDALYDPLHFSPIPQLTYGDAPVQLKASTERGQQVIFSSSNPGVAEINGDKLIVKGAGTAEIRATVSTRGYETMFYPRYITINKSQQTISWQSLTSKKFSDGSFGLDGFATSGLPVQYTTTTPGVVRISLNQVAILGGGKARIQASQPGNENYEAASPLVQEVDITDTGNNYNMIGSTFAGGPNHTGVIYSMNSDGASFGYLKQFNAQSSPSPQAGFIKGSDGKLYGMFMTGGLGNAGSVARLEADGSGLTILHDFNTTDGKFPSGNLYHSSDGYLYGTTQLGGTDNGGTIFRIKSDGTAFQVLFNFNDLSGRNPKGGVLQASNGRLYGTTPTGAPKQFGSIYGINTDGSGFAVLMPLEESLSLRTGSMPTGELIQGADAFLYGTLSNGGSNADLGCLFKIKPDGTGFNKFVVFNGTNGQIPGAGLTLGSDGKLYGMAGGSSVSLGTIYSVKPDGSDFVTLFPFTESTGKYPKGKLIEGTDGNLYGTTSMGGNNNFGTVFSVGKTGANYHKLVDLDERATYPQYGPLVEGTNGNFIGMTANGGKLNAGAIFKVTSGNVFTILNDFPQGEMKPHDLIRDETGKIYFGITMAQNWSEGGTIFRMNEDGTGYQSIYSVTIGDIITNIFYASTKHIWVSGIHNNENFLFRMKPDGTGIEQITSFNNAMAGQRKPVKTMTEAPDGTIYGGSDGNWSNAMLFRIKNNGTDFVKMNELPESARITTNVFYDNGNIYFAYWEQGIYRMTSAGEVSQIFQFPAEAQGPRSSKIIGLNGGRLGIVAKPSGPGHGLIFSIEKDGTDYNVIYKPSDREGGWPVDMIQSMDGWLYVVSEADGSNDKGVIYKVRSDGSSYTKLRDFDGNDGETPTGLFFKRSAQILTCALLPEVRTSSPAFSPDASSSSGAPIIFTSSNTQIAVIENGKIRPKKKGSVTITASLPANANFLDGGSIARTLVVTKGEQIISFDDIAAKKKSDAPFELRAQSDAGLPVSFKSSDNSVASVIGSSVTIHKAGTVIITVSQPGNDDFFAATDVQRTLVIKDGGSQLITFMNPGSHILGTNSFALTSSASSGLTVEYVATSSNITIADGKVTMLSAGKATIRATQSGNDDYDAAAPVETTFCINPAKPVISELGSGEQYQIVSSNDVGNQWFMNSTLLTGETSKYLQPDRDGEYTVQTKIDGCASAMSDVKLFITTGIEVDPEIQIGVYPNPFTNSVNINAVGLIPQDAVLVILDAMGRSVTAPAQLFAGDNTYDLGDSPKGMYFVRMILKGKVVMLKVIKE